MSNNKKIRNVMLLVQELIAFIHGSTKMFAWFSKFQDENPENQKKSLRLFCPTRWALRLVSLQTTTSNYEAILDWRQEVDDNEKSAVGVKLVGIGGR